MRRPKRAADQLPTSEAAIVKLSNYIAGAHKRPLPMAVVAKAKHHVLDTLAAMLSGSKLAPGAFAISYVRSQGGRAQCGVVGSRFRTTAVNAALANGMLAHADETDDSHPDSITHPGCAVLPAALTLAEQYARNGADFIRAVVLGYDIATRMTAAIGVKHLRGSTRSTHAIGGLFGAAAAAGAMVDLNAQRVRYLLSAAAQQASGLHSWVRDPDHIEKAFVFGGMPARNAVAAATMVAAGMTGVDDVFSGDRNFFSAFSETPSLPSLLSGLGRDFAIIETNIKKWCVGSPIQSVLDAVEILLRDHNPQTAAIARIDITMPTEQVWVVSDRDMPNICVQHLVAVLLIDGALGFSSSHDTARMRDPKVRRLRNKIVVTSSDVLSAARPRRQAVVTITSKDGRQLSRHCKIVRGTAGAPMSQEEVEAKARDLIEPVMGTRRTERLIAAIRDLEAETDMRRFGKLLQN